jgi:hypothetical protein
MHDSIKSRPNTQDPYPRKSLSHRRKAWSHSAAECDASIRSLLQGMLAHHHPPEDTWSRIETNLRAISHTGSLDCSTCTNRAGSEVRY